MDFSEKQEISRINFRDPENQNCNIDMDEWISVENREFLGWALWALKSNSRKGKIDVSLKMNVDEFQKFQIEHWEYWILQSIASRV